MKARLPKSFLSLPQAEKDAINRVCTIEVENRINGEFAKLQKLWIKYGVIVLHDYLGMTAEDCLLYLANWREVYRINMKIEDAGTQREYLGGKMREIFGDTDFLDKYLDKLEGVKE